MTWQSVQNGDHTGCGAGPAGYGGVLNRLGLLLGWTSKNWARRKVKWGWTTPLGSICCGSIEMVQVEPRPRECGEECTSA
jgi:hypothetical protein